MTDQERIDHYQSILDAGAVRVSLGDKVMEYDLAEIQRLRDQLIAEKYRADKHD